jgi:hypothetical protein
MRNERQFILQRVQSFKSVKLKRRGLRAGVYPSLNFYELELPVSNVLSLKSTGVVNLARGRTKSTGFGAYEKEAINHELS